MGNRKGIIRAAIERFDSLMAIGQSRHAAKQAVREASVQPAWTVSSGKIHSHVTRKVYQQQTLAFINWARERYRLNRLERLDSRADELASQYLSEQLAAHKSAYTVQTQRCALRMFFGNRDLAASVVIPKRHRTTITRSRSANNENHHFQPDHWSAHVSFAQATGLRRSEMRDIKVHDVYRGEDGRLCVHVKNGKGGRSREVQVLPAYEQEILACVDGRQPNERVFAYIPKHMHVQTYRRSSSQARYLHHASESALPPGEGRLKHRDYDRAAAQEVSWNLGHNRLDVTLRHYLR